MFRLTRPIIPLLTQTPLRPARALSTTTILRAEGDTGSMRSGGDRHADTWSRREKAMEDMYIREREKEIMLMLKEKIAVQEKLLAKDRDRLNEMEDQYGHLSEEKAGT